MLTPRDCMPFLLERHPEFEPSWRLHLEHWQGSERGHYIDASGFVNWVLAAIADDDQSSLLSVSASLEALLEQGDSELSTLVIVGILESLMNICSHEPVARPFSRIARHLGPRSFRACQELDRGWGTRTDGVGPKTGA